MMRIINDGINWIVDHFLGIFIVLWGGYVWLPFLAPVFMQLGWVDSAERIYTLYSFFCHQLPQRSYFLFGEQFTYELSHFQQLYPNLTQPMALGRFAGSATMGWKISWSDRMISLYGGMWLWVVIWLIVPARWRPRLRGIYLPLFILPLALDGTTHLVSDLFFGIGTGFRDHNSWFALLTGNLFQVEFYAGDAFGTFNSQLRLFTGLLCSFGVVGWAAPIIRPS